MDLTEKKCVPCEGGTPPLGMDVIGQYLAQLKTPWAVVDGKRIRKEFKFKNFREAMVFVNKVADIAESEGHHPNLHISYNKVVLELWTHVAEGLTENDFIVAAKIETLTGAQK